MDQEFNDAEEQKQRHIVEEQKLNPGNLTLKIDSNASFSKLSLLYNSSSLTRANADLVCVVDVSGSMASEAKIQNSEGDLESKGLTILDIVKHAVKTIADNLTETDRMSLVTFDDKADLIFGLTKMDQKGKQSAFESIESLRDLGSTNLWDGVYQGLEVLRTQSQIGKNQAVLVFTDGMPNVVPPRGHIPMLKQYKEKYPEMKPVVHTFGFGYSMDSQLLDEIAQEASGNYAFIPDSSLVGTVFVNSLSNILPTIATNVQINVESCNGAKIKSIPGGYQHLLTSWGAQIDIGTVQDGQSKDVIVEVEIEDQSKPFAMIGVQYLDLADSKHKEIRQEATEINNSQEIDIQRIRIILIQCIKNAFDAIQKQEDLNKAKQIIEETNNQINSFQFAKSNPYILDLLKDLNGQIKEATSRIDWFRKWGRHYLLSLMRAHLSQICNNFKDPGVQHYGGKLFKEIRDKADEAFLKLPPPKPSKEAYIQKKGQSGQYGQKISQGKQKKVNMQAYHNARGPCFDGNCLIELEDGKEIRVQELKKGDIVKTGRNQKDRVVCIVETFCEKGVEFVEFESGLKITPWHPIYINGQWTFPIDVNHNLKTEKNPVTIYSIVIEREYSVFINGIQCASLGHCSKKEGLSHPYFGSKKVIGDLKEMEGWDMGMVRLNAPCLKKNSETGLVEKLIQTF